MSSKIKLQHYVPKFYLQYFSIMERKDYVYCFDKSDSSSFRVNIKNIASETYFYDDAKDIDQKFEKALGYLESSVKCIYKKLIEEKDLSCLTTSEKAWLVGFIAIQLIRTKQQRLMLKYQITQLAQSLTDTILTDAEIPVESLKLIKQELDRRQTEEGIKELHIRAFRKVRELVWEILQMKWILLLNKSTIPYWTSDNPVFPPTYHSMSRVQLQIPLSPKVCLWICDQIKYGSKRSKYEISNSERIMLQNYWQVRGSTKYVFSCKNDFSEAEKTLKANPYLADIGGKEAASLLLNLLRTSQTSGI